MPWSLRREVLRTFGILGALDPYKEKIIQDWLRRSSSIGEEKVRGSGDGRGS